MDIEKTVKGYRCESNMAHNKLRLPRNYLFISFNRPKRYKTT